MPRHIAIRSGRSFDRLINFTDGVVAVAITVLVLPIVDLHSERGENTVWEIVSDNSGQIFTFVFTFIVVAVMWQVHNRVVNRLIGYDDVIFWLNLLWLLSIAFLPWSSVMYGVGLDGTSGEANWSDWSGGEGLGGTGLLYWGNLAVASFVSNAIAWHARRHPQLIDPDSPRVFKDTGVTHWRGAIFGGLFLAIGFLSLVIPQIAIWLPLALVPIASLVGRGEVKRD
jgi:uncharacterized membrane protein